MEFQNFKDKLIYSICLYTLEIERINEIISSYNLRLKNINYNLNNLNDELNRIICIESTPNITHALHDLINIALKIMFIPNIN